MPYTVAIQPDQLTQKNGEKQSFSSRWAARAADSGVNVRTVDVYAPDFFRQLAGCDGFMWRFGYSPNPRLFAKRLLPAIEHGLGIPVFPSFETVTLSDRAIAWGEDLAHVTPELIELNVARMIEAYIPTAAGRAA